MNLSGMQVVVSPYLSPIPKVQLSDKCPCTDLFRSEFNFWLKEFFGEKEPFIVLNGKLFTSLAGYEAMRVDLEDV